MKLFSVFLKRKFYIHVAIAIAVTFFILAGTSRYLEHYTRHKEVYVVPDFFGKEADGVISDFGKRFNFIIIDSIYVKDAESGSVLQQDPFPGSKVKEGRNVYLVTVAKMPDHIPMPNLRNLSLRQALVILESSSLIPNTINVIEHFARNAVVDQFLDGTVIEPGTPVFKGSLIDLQVGDGGAIHRVAIPSLLGKKRKEAISLLLNASLNLGEEFYPDGYDTVNSRVFRTEPNLITERLTLPGSKVNLYFRSEMKFDFAELERVYLSDSTKIDSIFYQETFVPENDVIQEEDIDAEEDF
jgi:eukaryotic-like serine/threonine-protein kinase